MYRDMSFMGRILLLALIIDELLISLFSNLLLKYRYPSFDLIFGIAFEFEFRFKRFVGVLINM